jgi:hypothetical protein
MAILLTSPCRLRVLAPSQAARDLIAATAELVLEHQRRHITHPLNVLQLMMNVQLNLIVTIITKLGPLHLGVKASRFGCLSVLAPQTLAQ